MFPVHAQHSVCTVITAGCPIVNMRHLVSNALKVELHCMDVMTKRHMLKVLCITLSHLCKPKLLMCMKLNWLPIWGNMAKVRRCFCSAASAASAAYTRLATILHPPTPTCSRLVYMTGSLHRSMNKVYHASCSCCVSYSEDYGHLMHLQGLCVAPCLSFIDGIHIQHRPTGDGLECQLILTCLSHVGLMGLTCPAGKDCWYKR